MVLHFVIDEKVTDQIIENFSKAHKNSYFLVFGNIRDGNFKYISHSRDRLIRFIEEEDDINDLIKQLKPTSILTHAFHLEYAKVILKIKNDIKIAWYTWGFDVYGLPRIKPKLYAPLTNTFLLKKKPGLHFGRIILKNNFLRKLFYYFNKKEEDRYSIIFNALKKVNFFVTYLEDDYDHYSCQYPNQFTFINCPFSTINQYLADNSEINMFDDASNVLIGNSNSGESNHLDAFTIIQKHGFIGDIKIYVPLSYGDDITYRNEVIEKGEKLLTSSFVPLLHFMHRAEYILILKSCSTGVFYHYRQQAMGNIIAMLYLGARIYLSSKNPAYSFFIKNNITIFDLDNDYEYYKNTKLETEIAYKNKEMLNKIFNEKKVLEDIKKLINVLS